MLIHQHSCQGKQTLQYKNFPALLSSIITQDYAVKCCTALFTTKQIKDHFYCIQHCQKDNYIKPEIYFLPKLIHDIKTETAAMHVYAFRLV